MDKSNKTQILEMIERLARINHAEQWTNDLNPSQWAALKYLARANCYSRAPSHVADYLGATRGTVSQTLKALVRKGLIEEVRSETDRRSIRYDVLMRNNSPALDSATSLDQAIALLGEKDSQALAKNLRTLLQKTLKTRGGRSFGMCNSCTHHRRDANGNAHCALLQVDLMPSQHTQICHEHSHAA